MLAGAAIMTLIVLWRRLRKATSKALWIYFGLAVFASLFAYFFFDSYNTKTLVPALQSPWFAPHVFVYIFAYTLLGVAVVIAFVLLQMCWWGINYLPSAQGSSVHTYSTSEK